MERILAAMTYMHAARHPPGELHLALEVQPPNLYIRLNGDLDVSSAHQLTDPTSLNLADVTSVHLDLGNLAFCDLTGLQTLLDFREKHLQENRTVLITLIHPNMLQLFKTAGVSRTIFTAPDAT